MSQSACRSRKFGPLAVTSTIDRVRVFRAATYQLFVSFALSCDAGVDMLFPAVVFNFANFLGFYRKKLGFWTYYLPPPLGQQRPPPDPSITLFRGYIQHVNHRQGPTATKQRWLGTVTAPSNSSSFLCLSAGATAAAAVVASLVLALQLLRRRSAAAPALCRTTAYPPARGMR